MQDLWRVFDHFMDTKYYRVKNEGTQNSCIFHSPIFSSIKNIIDLSVKQKKTKITE